MLVRARPMGGGISVVVRHGASDVGSEDRGEVGDT